MEPHAPRLVAPDPRSAAPRDPRPRAGRGKLLLVVLAAVGLGCVGMGLLAVGVGALVAGGEGEPLSPEESELLITYERLRPFVPVPPTLPGRELAERRDHFDGTVELLYEYEVESDVEGFYVQSGVTVAADAAGARFAYRGMQWGMGLGLGLEGGEVREVERDDLFSWGDESRCTVLETPEGSVGNFVIARRDRRIFHVVVAGVFFDDSVALHELLDPHLARLDRYDP